MYVPTQQLVHFQWQSTVVARVLTFLSLTFCLSYQTLHTRYLSCVCPYPTVSTFLVVVKSRCSGSYLPVSNIFCRSFQTVCTCYLSRVCPLPNSQYISSGSQKSLFGFLPSCLSILSLIPNCPYILFITCMSFTQQLVHFQWQSKVVTRVLTFLSLIFFRSYQAVRTCYLSRVCPLSQKLLSGFSSFLITFVILLILFPT